MKKFILLALALLLPVLVYVFLRLFGKNEFDIPVFYETEMKVPEHCGFQPIVPYTLPDSVLGKAGWSDRPATLLLVEPWVGPEGIKELKRVKEEFSDDEVSLLILSTLRYQPVDGKLILNHSEFGLLIHCFLLMNKPQSVILVDQSRRIRGYYNADSREDVDRMLMELAILLKKY